VLRAERDANGQRDDDKRENAQGHEHVAQPVALWLNRGGGPPMSWSWWLTGGRRGAAERMMLIWCFTSENTHSRPSSVSRPGDSGHAHVRREEVQRRGKFFSTTQAGEVFDGSLMRYSGSKLNIRLCRITRQGADVTLMDC
jgi:hypothetical protein